MSLPFLSIVIPVRNEEKHIAAALEQILGQEYPRDKLEILVIDGKSSDNTKEIVKNFANRYSFIRLLDNPKILSSSARNLGVREAKGDVVVYIDGHCQIPDRQLLKNIASCFEKSGADCLGRSQPLIPGDRIITQAITLARTSALGHNPESFIYSEFEGFINPTSCGAIYKKEVFQKVGCFDENFDACEDVEFNLRVKQAGLKCYLSPSLAVRYYPRQSLPGLFQQMFRYGQGRYQLFRKHPPTRSFFTVLPGLYLLLLLFLILLSGVNPALLTFLVFALPLYLGPALIFSIRLALKKGLKFLPLLLLIFPIIHFGISLGFWFALFSSLKRT
jgi:succinoglycan biosynthesis protein ExoA